MNKSEWLVLNIVCGALLVATSGCATTVKRPSALTEIQSSAMAKQLLGTRPLSLQWISWNDFGHATVRNIAGRYVISGKQRHTGISNDYIKIDGTIPLITDTAFDFDGTIEIQVSHINGGKPYKREGRQRFRLYGNRRFWRLAAMVNEFGSFDYVDIYFDRKAAKASPAH